ncbi:hypothetical protein H1C71_039854 [Ictidomys tridecemlineatus]|nr:hypothetical protein H1C71_039854 [Ictidomys tridecemlineatus]
MGWKSFVGDGWLWLVSGRSAARTRGQARPVCLWIVLLVPGHAAVHGCLWPCSDYNRTAENLRWGLPRSLEGLLLGLGDTAGPEAEPRRGAGSWLRPPLGRGRR